MGKFEELRVWRKAKAIAVSVYRLTKKEPLSKDFGLSNQLQRAAVSIPSNIAEGDESGTNKLSIRYFYTAKASAAELFTQVLIAYEVGLISKENCDELISECNSISSMLNKLILARGIKQD